MSKSFQGCARLAQVKKIGFKEPVSDNCSLAGGVLADIFAPDPVTGVPRSDVHFMLSGSLDPALSEYVRRNLMRPQESTSCPDKDCALELTRGKMESVGSYQQRVQAYIKSLNSVEDE